MSVVNVVKDFIWGEDICLIFEHCFGIELDSKGINISHEHTKYEWLTYEDA